MSKTVVTSKTNAWPSANNGNNGNPNAYPREWFVSPTNALRLARSPAG
ncbi:MAG: hypothetical protein ACI87E_005103 [Mariniblastus sp.]|jgi:hypothetical protein